MMQEFFIRVTVRLLLQAQRFVQQRSDDLERKERGKQASSRRTPHRIKSADAQIYMDGVSCFMDLHNGRTVSPHTVTVTIKPVSSESRLATSLAIRNGSSARIRTSPS